MQKRHFSKETEKWRLGESALFLIFQIILSVEFFHTSGGIDNLLFAGVERMADVTDINVHFTFGGFCLKSIATSAGDHHLVVFGMNTLFH